MHLASKDLLKEKKSTVTGRIKENSTTGISLKALQNQTLQMHQPQPINYTHKERNVQENQLLCFRVPSHVRLLQW